MSNHMSNQRWTVSEAARALGVSEKTVYRRIKSGRLSAKLEGGPDSPHWMIDRVDRVDGVDTVDRDRGQVSRHRVEQIEAGKSPVLDVLREQLQEKDRQIAELHVLLREAQGQLQRLLPAPIGKTETYEHRKRRWWWPF